MREHCASVRSVFLRKGTWLFGAGGAFVLTVTFFSVVSSYTKYRYQYILSQPKVLEAFFNNDEAAIHSVAEEYRLAYQKVMKGEVTFQSQEFLPAVNVITAVIQPEKNVLTQDVPTAMKNLDPYILLIKGDIFLAFPLFSSESFEGGYIIYLPLFV